MSSIFFILMFDFRIRTFTNKISNYSATLDLAYVATGAFDIWWEGGCWEW